MKLLGMPRKPVGVGLSVMGFQPRVCDLRRRARSCETNTAVLTYRRWPWNKGFHMWRAAMPSLCPCPPSCIAVAGPQSGPLPFPAQPSGSVHKTIKPPLMACAPRQEAREVPLEILSLLCTLNGVLVSSFPEIWFVTSSKNGPLRCLNGKFYERRESSVQTWHVIPKLTWRGAVALEGR